LFESAVLSVMIVGCVTTAAREDNERICPDFKSQLSAVQRLQLNGDWHAIGPASAKTIWGVDPVSLENDIAIFELGTHGDCGCTLLAQFQHGALRSVTLSRQEKTHDAAVRRIAELAALVRQSSKGREIVSTAGDSLRYVWLLPDEESGARRQLVMDSNVGECHGGWQISASISLIGFPPPDRK
jgi:hypothetical protein